MPKKKSPYVMSKGTGPKIGQKPGPITPKPKKGTRSAKKSSAIEASKNA